MNVKLTNTDRRHAGPLECAGKAQRRRRFDCAETLRRASQSGVALRLPPHSKSAGAPTECSPFHGPLSRRLTNYCLPGQAQRAFSLIELIGVLAVIAILAAVLVPALIRQLDKIAGDQESAALKSFGGALQASIMRLTPAHPANHYVP